MKRISSFFLLTLFLTFTSQIGAAILNISLSDEKLYKSYLESRSEIQSFELSHIEVGLCGTYFHWKKSEQSLIQVRNQPKKLNTRCRLSYAYDTKENKLNRAFLL